MRTGLE